MQGLGGELALEPDQAIVVAQLGHGGVPGARHIDDRPAVQVELIKVHAAPGFDGGDIDVAKALHA